MTSMDLAQNNFFPVNQDVQLFLFTKNENVFQLLVTVQTGEVFTLLLRWSMLHSPLWSLSLCVQIK